MLQIRIGHNAALTVPPIFQGQQKAAESLHLISSADHCCPMPRAAKLLGFRALLTKAVSIPQQPYQCCLLPGAA